MLTFNHHEIGKEKDEQKRDPNLHAQCITLTFVFKQFEKDSTQQKMQRENESSKAFRGRSCNKSGNVFKTYF